MQANPLLRALATAALLALVGCGGHAAGASAVRPEQVLASIDAGSAPLLLDVRTPEEFASGHVPGALNIPYDELAARTGELAARRAEEVVVYCETGRRAARAADVLATAGFGDVRLLDGHMRAWRDAGLPTE